RSPPRRPVHGSAASPFWAPHSSEGAPNRDLLPHPPCARSRKQPKRRRTPIPSCLPIPSLLRQRRLLPPKKTTHGRNVPEGFISRSRFVSNRRCSHRHARGERRAAALRATICASDERR